MLTGRYLCLGPEGEIRADCDYDTHLSNPDFVPQELAMV